MGRMHIRKGNIALMDVDCVVNAANRWLAYGGGVCGAIFDAAGVDELQEECDYYGTIDEGDAVVTNGYNLNAKYVIHAVGPVWNNGNSNEEQKLRRCYRKTMQLADELGVKSIALPVISSGIFGYPKEEAIRICLEEIRNYIVRNKYDVDAYIVSMGDDTFRDVKRIAYNMFRRDK